MKQQRRRHRTPPARTPQASSPQCTRGSLDQALARDARYFEEYPDRRWYVRPAVPGEHWPHDAAGITHTIVVRGDHPGLRYRAAIRVPPGEDPEAIARHLVGHVASLLTSRFGQGRGGAR